MDLMTFVNLIPVVQVAIVFGLTWAIRSFCLKKWNDVPAWFVFVPMILGFFGAAIQYMAETDSKILTSVPIREQVWDVIWKGLITGSVAISAWQVTKKFLPATDDEKPDEPPKGPPNVG